MRLDRWAAAAILGGALLSGAALADVESARSLYRRGKLAEAKRVLEETLSSTTDESERARALDLLGSVSARLGDPSKALESWQLLVAEFPASTAAQDAVVKILLATQLLECREGEADPPPAAPPEAAAAPPPIPAAPPAPATPPAGPAGAAGASVAAPSPPPAEAERLVLVAGRGAPYDAVVEAIEAVVGHLEGAGIPVESAVGGVPVERRSSAVLPELLRAAADRRAASVLLVTAEFERAQKIVAECYDLDGRPLWRERVVGGTGWTGREWTASGVNRNLLERLLGKLEERLDDFGLE